MSFSSISHSTSERLAEPNPSASRRNRVLDEAAKQLNANGVSLTSLAEIAAKLGISRAAMYYYVEDRQDLVFQCYRRACEIVGRHLDDAVSVGGNPREVIARFIANILHPSEREVVASAETGMMTESQRAEVASVFEPIVQQVRELLDAGQRAGLFRQCDSYANARTILSLLSWAQLVQRWGTLLSPVSRDRVLTVITELIFEGFAARQSKELSYRPIDLSPVRIRTTTLLERDSSSDVKREALVAVASRLFNRKGIDSTSLEEIAAQVGATKRTLHRHLGSKQALVDACYERAFQVFRFIRDRMLSYEGSRLQAVCAAFHGGGLVFASEDIAVIAPQVGMNSLQPEGKQKLLESTLALSRDYTRMLEEGIAEGSIRPGDVEALIVMMPGAFSWLVGEDGPTEPEQREAIAREVVSLFALGLMRRS